MQLNKLYPARGSTHKRKTLGRGEGSGHGGSATRGTKGQRSRSGFRKNSGFEGGQMTLLRRIPKRGFSNRRFQKKYSIVNINQLEEKFDKGAEINPALLYEYGLLKKKKLPVKILGDGNLTKKFIVKAQAFSKSAVDKIKSCGGKIDTL
jgi:large subunit ribosomal protein L15